MPQFQLSTITFFFFLLSAIFATGTPTCSKWNHCHNSSKSCGPAHRTTTTSTMTTGSVKSSQLPVPTQSPAQPAATPTRSNHPSPSSSVKAGNTSNADIQAYLTAHNSVRAEHDAAPLTWSDNLASAAQEWANGCVFKHSEGTLGPFGENIAAGFGLSISDAVSLWTEEVSDYDPNNPIPSHFTQVVWKATTQLGCAVKSCNKILDDGPANFYVCEYSPAGNVIGSFSQNVQA